MPTPTYKYIAKAVLTGTSAEVEFNSLGNYKDLAIHISARGNANDWANQLRMYGNLTTTGRSDLFSRGISSASQVAKYTSGVGVIGYQPSANATSNVFGFCWLYIPDYQSTTMNKIVYADSIIFGNYSTGEQITTSASTNLGLSSSALTNIRFYLDSGSFVANSTFYVYGID